MSKKKKHPLKKKDRLKTLMTQPEKLNLGVEGEEDEINPEKLDRHQLVPDQAGADTTKRHEPYDL